MSQPFSDQEKQLLFSLRREKVPFKEIQSKHFPDRSIDFLCWLCKKARIVRVQEKWTEEEVKILRDCAQNGMKFKETLKLLPKRNYATVVKFASDHGIRNFITGGSRKYYSNDSFWETPNFRNSYWGGFAASDGNIHIKDGTYGFNIGLQRRDIRFLELFKKETSYTGTIKLTTATLREKKFPSANITINNWAWQKGLEENFGIFPRKTWSLNVPNIPKKFIPYYIAGFLDGDGAYSVSDNKLSISCFSLSFPVLSLILEFSNQFIGKKSNRPRKLVKFRNGHTFQIKGQPAVHMAQYLMSLPCPHLERKYNRVRDYLLANPQYNLSLPPYEESLAKITPQS